jgi:hypothetical protein
MNKNQPEKHTWTRKHDKKKREPEGRRNTPKVSTPEHDQEE